MLLSSERRASADTLPPSRMHWGTETRSCTMGPPSTDVRLTQDQHNSRSTLRSSTIKWRCRNLVAMQTTSPRLLFQVEGDKVGDGEEMIRRCTSLSAKDLWHSRWTHTGRSPSQEVEVEVFCCEGLLPKFLYFCFLHSPGAPPWTLLKLRHRKM